MQLSYTQKHTKERKLPILYVIKYKKLIKWK
jgi:hypothetical protein